MQRLTGLVEEVTAKEVESWPRGVPAAFHGRLQALTLEIILRAVFGLDEGERLDALRTRLTEILEHASQPGLSAPPLQRMLLAPRRWPRFVQLKEETDALLFDLVDERRAEGADRDDVLSMLLAARHQDGSEMSPAEIRDELMTLLVAGHETTASELAWAFERLVREPRVAARLRAEVDAGEDDSYLKATIQETLRRRPVLPNVAPRLVMKPIEVGGWEYPTGVSLVGNAYLLHHDPDVYDDPYAFRPERFLEEPPGTYTWIPFGGGRRRCIGASFAQLEMRIVLRAVFERYELAPGGDGPELTRRRSITVSPRRGAETVLLPREPVALHEDRDAVQVHLEPVAGLDGA
jgi:cytochrome P450